MDKSEIINAEGIFKQYGLIHALNGVDITIYENEWISIMGPSGSGKTTLLNILGCLDKPSKGRLLINNRNVLLMDKDELTEFRGANFGFVFQQFHLIPYLNALENVMVAQYFTGYVDREKAQEILEKMGLKDRLFHFPDQLSGGEQQRVAIARAIINEPEIIFADEPTGNLDQETGKTVLDLLKEQHERGSTLLLVTHESKIGKLADRLVTLIDGKICKITER
jgi:putative ABC transport system ATP-binding protein